MTVSLRLMVKSKPGDWVSRAALSHMPHLSEPQILLPTPISLLSPELSLKVSPELSPEHLCFALSRLGFFLFSDLALSLC